MNSKRFIAAYSEHPFSESKKQASYPDYYFYYADGLHWCVRVGEIEIPWGVRNQKSGYSANGSIFVSRRNVDASLFDGKGFPFKKIGKISYLYESEFTSGGFEGFADYIREKLIGCIYDLSDNVGPDEFKIAMEGLKDNPNVKSTLKEHMIEFKSVSISDLRIIDTP